MLHHFWIYSIFFVDTKLTGKRISSAACSALRASQPADSADSAYGKLKILELEIKLKEAENRLKSPKKKKTLPHLRFIRRIRSDSTGVNKHPSSIIGQKDITFLSSNDFRVKYERIILYSSLACVVLLLCFLSVISLFIVPILILFSAIMIKTKQGQLLGQSIKVSDQQLPDVYEAGKIAAKRLSMKMPDIFVTQTFV